LAAGFSFTLMVFPYGIVRLYGTLPFDLRELMGMIGPITLMWAIGGILVNWHGGGWLGGILLGLCGLLSGAALALGVGDGSETSFTLTGALVGLLYGAPLGILLGLTFPNPDQRAT
jgi:hypothetical protein